MKKTVLLLGILTLAVPLLFLGCGELEGDRGPAGPPGPPGPPGTGTTGVETCAVCHQDGAIADVAVVHAVEPADTFDNTAIVTINSVGGVPGNPVVNFTVQFPPGSTANAAALTGENFRFTIAKLIPDNVTGPGDPSLWRSYINDNVDGDVIADRESGSDGTLANTGGGTYTYTFATDVGNVTSPIAVPFEADLTHRAGMELRGDIPRGDAVFTFVPGGGAGSGTREVVDVSSCNECHQRLAAHGNGRFDTAYCVVCHNPAGGTDPETGNTIDFKVMIHKIHRGEDLPSVQAGTPYVVYGGDFSNVVFPAGPSIPELRHCTKCHDNTVAVDADNWRTVPSREACGSCHDDVNFDTGLNHPGGPQPTNAGCSAVFCHGSPSLNPEATHAIPQVAASQDFQFNILGVDNTAPGQRPVVTFSVTNPSDNSAYNILTDPAFTVAQGGASRLAILIGWPTADYTNRGSGGNPAQPISINPLSFGAGAVPATQNPDGSFTVVSPTPIPDNVTGSGVVALEGHPAVPAPPPDNVVRVPVKNAFQIIPITDASPVPRREVVDIAKCNQCHVVLSLHGNNRTDEINVCVICHNPNATDIGRRPPGGADNTADQKREEAIDFKRMIHAIHAGEEGEHGVREEGIVVYGFGGTAHDYSEVRFPGILNNCEGCHLPGTYQPPLGDNVLATTIDTGADIASPADDLNITPTAAVCSSCHDSAFAVAHMQQMGASFEFVQP